MRVDEFDFDLPEECIALRPVRPRDAARLLCVDPHAADPFQERRITDLPKMLKRGDALVFNNTRVIPARLSGVRRREESAANVSVTLLKRLDKSRWQALTRPAKRLKEGDRIAFGETGNVCLAGTLWAGVERREEDSGEAILNFDFHGNTLDEVIAVLGQMPLPPYITTRREPDARDMDDYQTVYAREAGAVAAPTAGLHFTPELTSALEAAGISHHFVTLHVGAGTFLPVKSDDTDDHEMHSEWGEVSEAVAGALNRVRARGGRLIAVGSTSLRLLESAADDRGLIRAFGGETDIFITPGHEFRAVDAMITNFHLPRSTLFMLVAAFCGLDLMKRAYAHAIDESYRFYSYGDACFLLPTKAMT